MRVVGWGAVQTAHRGCLFLFSSLHGWKRYADRPTGCCLLGLFLLYYRKALGRHAFELLLLLIYSAWRDSLSTTQCCVCYACLSLFNCVCVFVCVCVCRGVFLQGLMHNLMVHFSTLDSSIMEVSENFF